MPHTPRNNSNGPPNISSETRNLFDDFPELLFGGLAPQRGFNFEGEGRSFFDFFTPERLQSSFDVAQGQRARSGQHADLNFVDFLTEFPFRNEFRAATPQQRGINNARFAPPARWLIPR